MANKKLSRQLKKTFENPEISSLVLTWKDGLEADQLAEKSNLIRFLCSFPDFLNIVNETYNEGDEKAELAQRNLEISSVELAEANKSLHSLNSTFDAMLNSLGQGFFIFNIEGECLPIYSKACEKLIDCKPSGKNLRDVLKVDSKELESFEEWYKLLFQDLIEFEDLAVLGPQYFPAEDKNKVISLEYRAVRDRENVVAFVLVIATDRTAEIQAQRKAEELQAHVKFLASALSDRSQFRRFVREARRLFHECVEIVRREDLDQDQIKILNMNLHTLKGAAGTFGVAKVKQEIHDIETKLKELKTPVEIKNLLGETISQVIGQFEILLEKNKEIVGDSDSGDQAGPTRELELKHLIDIANNIKGLSNVRAIYEAFVDKVISVPASKLFEPFNKPLQAVAKDLGKQINPLVVESDELSLIPENYTDFLSSLIHVFRNIADHGIESPDERQKLGKPLAGNVKTIVKRLASDNSRFSIFISDDGKGVNLEGVRKKLILQNKIKETDKLSNRELLDWLFAPDFSTAEKVTEYSGRGVGLSAVRHSVEQLGGTIVMESISGYGSSFYIELPILSDIRHDSLSLIKDGERRSA